MFMLFTHRKVHHHYRLFLLLFLYFTLGRKTSCSVHVPVLDADESRRLWIKKESKSECTRQLWKISVGEWSHIAIDNRLRGIFSQFYITWNLTYIKVLSRIFGFKESALNKLKFVKSRLVMHMVQVMLWFQIKEWIYCFPEQRVENTFMKCLCDRTPKWKMLEMENFQL